MPDRAGGGNKNGSLATPVFSLKQNSNYLEVFFGLAEQPFTRL